MNRSRIRDINLNDEQEEVLIDIDKHKTKNEEEVSVARDEYQRWSDTTEAMIFLNRQIEDSKKNSKKEKKAFEKEKETWIQQRTEMEKELIDIKEKYHTR